MTITLTEQGLLGAVQLGILSATEARTLLGFETKPTTEEEK